MAPLHDKVETLQLDLPENNGSDARTHSSASDSTLSDYGLRWLFDPNRRDHLPIEEQLEYYKQRDLRKVKIYKLATQLWGQRESRKRRIVAPPMEKVSNPREMNEYSRPTPPTHTELKPQKPPIKQPTQEEIAAEELEEKKRLYNSWMDERKKFRHNLDNMGLTEEYIARKPDKTEVEKRILRKMVEERLSKIVVQKEEEVKEKPVDVNKETPDIHRPSPMAIGIIENFLREKRMRLIDLFLASDKDKNWSVTHEEFRQAIKKAGIPISDVLVEDLIMTLDSDMNNELDYRELAKGMVLWRKEKRYLKKKILSNEKSKSKVQRSQLSGLSKPTNDSGLYGNFVPKEGEKGNIKVSAEKQTQRKSFEPASKKSATEDPFRKTQTHQIKYKSTAASPLLHPVGKISPASFENDSPRFDTVDVVKTKVTLVDDDSLRESRTPETNRRPSPYREMGSVTPVRYSPMFNMQEKKGYQKRQQSAVSNISSSSSRYLETPPQDLREEQLILSSDEAMVDLRSRTRASLNFYKAEKSPRAAKGRRSKKPKIHEKDISPIIKTGDVAIDSHNTLSSMDGETGAMVDKFRQLKYQEYTKILKLCHKNNVPLSEELLRKVLLFPGDRQPSRIMKSIRQPGAGTSHLTSQHFADPPKRPKTPLQEKFKDRIKITRTGEVIFDSRHAYPNAAKCENIPVRMNLSTGKAVIRRQVDCWMSFEEYDRLTKHLSVHYTQLHGHSDDNAFWPGHLLKKIHLHMPNREPLTNSMFNQVNRSGKKAYPESTRITDAWNINDNGYLQYGTIDPYHNKYIH